MWREILDMKNVFVFNSVSGYGKTSILILIALLHVETVFYLKVHSGSLEIKTILEDRNM